MVIAAPRHKEMRIALARFQVMQPFNRKNRNPPRLTEHPLSHLSTLRFLKYHLLSTSISLSFKLLPTGKKSFLTHPLWKPTWSTIPSNTIARKFLQPETRRNLKYATTHACYFLRGGQTSYTLNKAKTSDTYLLIAYQSLSCIFI